MPRRHSPPPNLSLTRFLSRALLIFLVIAATGLVLRVGTVVYVVGDLQRASDRYTRGSQALRDAHAALLDEETGLRGYLLARDNRFLDPYNEAQARLGDADARLADTLGSDPEFAPRLLEMRLRQQRWIDQWATPAAQLGVNGPAASEAFLGLGKTLFDGYRQAEVGLSGSIDAHSATVAAREVWAPILSTVIEAALLLAIISAVQRQRRRLRDSVLAPVDRLVEHMERVERGERPGLTPVGGPIEIRRIGEHLERMTTSLDGQRRIAERLGDQAEAQAARLRQVLSMAREISGSLSMRYVLRAVARSALAVSGYPTVRVAVLDERSAQLVTVHDSSRPDGTPLDGEAHDVTTGISGRAARFGQTVSAEERDRDDPLSGRVWADARLAVPMIVGAKVVGVITLFGEADLHALDSEVVQVLETLATHAATSVEAARLHGEVTEYSLIDPLTRLANRRQLDRDLDEECARSDRYHRPLAVVMLDVDNFKKFNDRYGHQRGDECLQIVGAILAQTMRATDTAYRYGGEEFLLLLRETDAGGAVQTAERVRSLIAERFQRGSGGGVTASFGVAERGERVRTPRLLVEAADAALYEAKKGGRNRVVAHRDELRGVVA